MQALFKHLSGALGYSLVYNHAMYEPLAEDDWEEEDWGPSRSQKKRDAQALLELGKKLAALNPAVVDKMELPAELLAAIRAVRDMQFGARKRQLKYIGGLLRKMDTESIEATMADLEARKEHADANFHLCEQWRDRLLNEGDTALTELMDEHPEADAGQIRQLIRNAQREQLQNKPPKSARTLFREIRTLLEN